MRRFRYTSYIFKVLQTAFVFSLFVQSFCFHPENCSWIINIVEKDNSSLVSTVIIPGKNYFIRLQVQCFSKVSSEVSRNLALTGVTPTVRVESRALIPDSNGYHFKTFVHTMETSLVELGSRDHCQCLEYASISTSSKNCYCGIYRPTCFGNGYQSTSNCCDTMDKECTSTGVLCNPAWLAPLPLGERVTSLYCSLVEMGIGPYMSSQSFVFHVDGFHTNQYGQVVNTLGQQSDSLQLIPVSGRPLKCIPLLSPSCVIAGLSQANIILYSSTEFATTQVVKVQGVFDGTSVCANDFSSLSVIREALSLHDTIILNTPVGLIEFRGKLSLLSATPGSPSNVLRRCIRQLVGPSAATPHLTTVVAIGDHPHQHAIFSANLQSGFRANFTELLDHSNQNVCIFLKAQLSTSGSDACIVVTASVESTAYATVVVLVQIQNALSSHHYLLRFNGTTTKGQWVLVSSIPAQIPDSSKDQEEWLMVDSNDYISSDRVTLPILNGMSHTAVVSSSLFIWGNVLLYSADGGSTIQRIRSFTFLANITVFTSSRDGTYAFLTDSHEVWVGVAGSAKVMMVQSPLDTWPRTPSPECDLYGNETIVTIFFDSLDKLQQVISCGDDVRRCVSRSRVSLEDIIASQNFNQKRLQNWKKNSVSKSSNTFCPSTTPEEADTILSTVSINQVTRACPFARLSVIASQSVNYSRSLHYTVNPPPFLDSTLLHSTDDTTEHFTRMNDTYGMDVPPSPIADDINDGELPREIMLHRYESYEFDLFLDLDHAEHIETSRHSWTMDHLQVSFRISDPSLVNVTATRIELVSYTAVKYQVIVQDRGVVFLQSPPGEGLVPTSLHVQIWNSALSCVQESKGGQKRFQGSLVMAVLLGCPANRKIVFDGKMSMSAAGKNNYCKPGESVPCFLFDIAFNPLFNVIDLTANHVTPFNGQYTLKIVGGGLDLDDIRDYSLEEQDLFNFRTAGSSAASLVWAAEVKSLGTVPVFNRTTNGIQWLCGPYSSCANINPKFPDNAEFFFKVEFSNKGVGATNCDYTLRFIIRVHGLPPGSLHPSSIIVLSCIGIMVTVILTLFILKRQEQKLLRKIEQMFVSGFASCTRKFSLQKKELNRLDQQAVSLEDGLEMENVDVESTTVVKDTEDKYRNPVGIAWDVCSNEGRQRSGKDASNVKND